MDIRNFTIKTLLLYEMPASMNGFGYIVDAVEIGARLTSSKNVMTTKDIYPRLARENKTTSAAVEKAIRYAIAQTGVKLTAKQFIMMLIRVYQSGAREPYTFV